MEQTSGHDGLYLDLLEKQGENMPSDANMEPEILAAQDDILKGNYDTLHKEVVQFVAAAQSMERVWAAKHPDDFAQYFKLKGTLITMYDNIARNATPAPPPREQEFLTACDELHQCVLVLEGKFGEEMSKRKYASPIILLGALLTKFMGTLFDQGKFSVIKERCYREARRNERLAKAALNKGKASLKALTKAPSKDTAVLDSIRVLVAEIAEDKSSLAATSERALRENKTYACVVAAAMQRMGNGHCPAPQDAYSCGPLAFPTEADMLAQISPGDSMCDEWESHFQELEAMLHELWTPTEVRLASMGTKVWTEPQRSK